MHKTSPHPRQTPIGDVRDELLWQKKRMGLTRWRKPGSRDARAMCWTAYRQVTMGYVCFARTPHVH
ncbi:hypothetical protein CBM2629_A100082 [Cupriavidus taiwanensis]|nr:hypothetical protein CBM2629_A100082 [Cupriavidus taiwanensis]